jgi:hypothetical protein
MSKNTPELKMPTTALDLTLLWASSNNEKVFTKEDISEVYLYFHEKTKGLLKEQLEDILDTVMPRLDAILKLLS